MAALDIFNDDAFSVHTLTAKINEQPYRPGQISDSGLFSENSVTTTIVSIELMAGNLSLVEPSVRGGPGETIGDDKRRLIPFEVDHYQRDDSVTADEVQNVRAFGTESEVETVQGRVIEKAARHLADLDMTIEHQRVGAIKGIVTSKSGRVNRPMASVVSSSESTPRSRSMRRTAIPPISMGVPTRAPSTSECSLISRTTSEPTTPHPSSATFIAIWA